MSRKSADTTVNELLDHCDPTLLRGDTAYFTSTSECGCKTRYALAIVNVDTANCVNGPPPIDPSGPTPDDKIN